MPPVNGSRIETARKRRGLKRSELAKVIGLSYKSVYGAERGIQPISHEKAHLIARALDIKLGDVLAATPDGSKEPPREPNKRPPNRKDNEGDKDRPPRNLAAAS